jgi:hypothetical protein
VFDLVDLGEAVLVQKMADQVTIIILGVVVQIKIITLILTK